MDERGDETDLKSPQVAEALQLWKDLVDEGSVSKSAVNWKQSDVNDQFIAGKAAMMLNGPWQIPSLQKAKVDFGVARSRSTRPTRPRSPRSVARRGPCR